MAGENRKGSRSVGGSFARAINSWAASLAVDSARLSARIYAVTGDSGRSCRTVSNPHVEILPAGPQLFRRSSTPRRQAAHMRISLILFVGGRSVVAIQTYGIREKVAAICTPRAAGAGSLKPSRPSFSVTDIVVWGAKRFESVLSVHVVGSLAPCPTAIGVRTGTSRPCRARDLRDRLDQPRGTCRHEPARCVRACRRVAP